MANPFGITEVDAPGLLQMYTQRQQQGLENQYRMGQLARQEKLDARADTEYDRKEGVRTGLVAAYDPETGKLDKTKARNAFLGAGDIAGALEFDDKELSRQKGEIEQYKAINEAALGLLNGVRDQASYTAAIGQAKALYDQYGHGAHFPEMPAQYDPKVVEALQTQTEEGRKVLDMSLKKAQAEETRRHNQATEGIAGGNLSLSRQRESRIKKWGPQAIILNGSMPQGDGTDLDAKYGGN